MILESVRVENFKCIDDSTEFTIRSLTALVGKNESGKTALLKALYRVNPLVAVRGAVRRHRVPAPAMDRPTASAATGRPTGSSTTTWQLEAPDVEALAAVLGADALASPRVVVTKGYDNRLRWQVDIDERRVVANLVRGAKLDATDLKSLWAVTTVGELVRILQHLEAPTPAQSALLFDVQQRFPARRDRRTGDRRARAPAAEVPLLRRVPPAARPRCPSTI